MSADLPVVEQRLTTEECAQVGRRHVVTVRRALEAGTLHGTQQGKGGRWTVRVSCLEAWLDGESCTHQQAAESVVELAGARGRRAS